MTRSRLHNHPYLLRKYVLGTGFVFLLGSHAAFSQEAKTPALSREPTQATAPATAPVDPEKTLTEALDALDNNSTTDFLMEKPPLTQSTVPSFTSQSLTSASTNATPPGAMPAPLELLEGRLFQKKDEVTMLISEQCTQTGTAGHGTNSCARTYSNGHRTTVLTENIHENDALKQRTVIEQFDGDSTLLSRKTIRHRTDYTSLNGQKAKEKELFDVVYQQPGQRSVREFMVYEYFPDTGKTRSLSWTQYQQAGDEPKAELVYHAMLRYGDDGSPDRGLAERWSKGEKAETFLNWSRRSKGFATLDEGVWDQWESWIRSVSFQAYLP